MVPSERLGLEMFKRAACSRLKDELLNDGIAIAGPIGTCALDMVAWVNSRDGARPGISVPIKVLAVRADELSRNLECTKASGLVVALVWNGLNPGAVRTFAFTPAELIVVRMIALIERENATHMGKAVDPGCAQDTALQEAMEPFTVSPGQWRKKIMTMSLGRSASGTT
jgi:hypothetical protein